MSPSLSQLFARAAIRNVPVKTTEDAATTGGVTIYVSDPNEAVERLAELDSTRCPSGPVLVAAVAGEPLAALPLDGGPAIADPFRRTAELVSLLDLRVAQMSGRTRRGRLARLVAGLLPGARAAGDLTARA